MEHLSAHDIARELRRRLPTAGVVKLHKLLYYCQGWHQTWTGRPLFVETIEAWTNGPVVAELWADEKHGRPTPEARELGDAELATVDYVVGKYGLMSGRDLIRLTHQEDPWRHASESEDPWGRDPEITLEAMESWFRSSEDFLSHRKAADRLRERSDVHGLGPLQPSPQVRDAVRRTAAGERVRHTRPA